MDVLIYERDGSDGKMVETKRKRGGCCCLDKQGPNGPYQLPKRGIFAAVDVCRLFKTKRCIRAASLSIIIKHPLTKVMPSDNMMN
jgi:hypothetical protein